VLTIILKLFFKTMLRREHCRSVMNLLTKAIVDFVIVFIFSRQYWYFMCTLNVLNCILLFDWLLWIRSIFRTFHCTRILKGKTKGFFLSLALYERFIPHQNFVHFFRRQEIKLFLVRYLFEIILYNYLI